MIDGLINPIELDSLASCFTQQKPTAKSSADIQRLQTIATMMAKREMEGLALYKPLPYLDAFHQCLAKWRILDGSNRASKTLTGCVEDCRAWLGCDPYGKYPNRNGKSIVVAIHQDSLAMMWRKCAEPGEFKIIRDERTQRWRAVQPDPNDSTVIDPYDMAYIEKWRDAPPLIPPRMLDGRPAWEDAGKGVPRVVKFTTGWRVLFRSSGGAGRPDQGANYDHAHLDEQIGGMEFFNEVSRGLVQVIPNLKYMPRAYWTATAQVMDANLLDLREKAEAGDPDVAVFKAFIEKNPYITAEERKRFWNSLSPDERDVRYEGNYAIVGRRIYGEYQPMGSHGTDPFPVPENWCIWVVLDPGRKHCGTLLAAVDPDEKHVWVYGGFDLQHAGATRWALTLKQHLQGRRPHGVICDQQMGRQTSADEIPEASYYWDAMVQVGVVPEVQADLYGFFPGPNNIPAREAALQSWLQTRIDCIGMGTPKLQVMRGVLPELDRQISRACYDDQNPDKRKKMRQDLLDCLEYLAATNPGYFPPGPKDVPKDFDIDEYLSKQRISRSPAMCRIG